MRLLLLIFFIATVATSNAQLSLEGRYMGSNLYIQNPWDEYDNFCVDSIVVNALKYSDAMEFGAFQIKLDSLGFAIDDPLEIQIYHKEGCLPKVLNQTSHYQRSNILIADLRIDEDSLHWKANESITGRFEIQVYRWNKWVTLDSVQKSINATEFNVAIKSDLHSGENVFRIKFINIKGEVKYSEEIKLFANKEELSYSINYKTNSIEFSEVTRYEFYDEYGLIVLQGKSTSVNLNKLPNKFYYLNLDNRNTNIKLKH